MKPIARFCMLAIVALSLEAAALHGQAPASKPDSPAVRAIVERATRTAGTMWAAEAKFFCETPRANSPNDPPIEPTKIFDNVYVVGNIGTVAYVLSTSAGLVMIDALGATEVESVLLPGLKALGLDPAQVKAILVGHGHADHFGGTAYMQEHYGSKIYISEADWTVMENPAPARGGRQGGPPTPLPKRDQVITGGQPLVFGDLTVQPVAVPGHTPGSMGFVFAVKDNGRTRMAALYGGTILTPGFISDEGLQTYLQSVARFKEATRKAKVEVEIQNHPLMDPIQVKLDRLRARKKGEPNPFVVGTKGYQTFLDVMSICTEANIERRKPL